MIRSMASVRVPPRYARVNAWVISRDTDAEVRWLASAFGAVETPGSRILDPDGDIGHVEVELGDSVIMLFDAKPDWPPTPAHLRVYVGDVEAAVEQAVAAGARVVTLPTLLAFGERVARVRDPQGHLWWLHEHVEDVSPEDMASRFADPAAMEAMAYVQRTLWEEMAPASLRTSIRRGHPGPSCSRSPAGLGSSRAALLPGYARRSGVARGRSQRPGQGQRGSGRAGLSAQP